MIRLLLLRREQDGFESDRPVHRTIDITEPALEELLGDGWYVLGAELRAAAPEGEKEGERGE